MIVLTKIVKICYEPYIVLAAIGMLCCIITRRWKLLAGGGGLLLIMIGWRLKLGIGSSRYGFAVLFPIMFWGVLAGTCIEIFLVEKFSSGAKKYCAVFLGIVIAIFSLWNVFRPSSNRNYMLKLGDAIRQDAKKYSSAIIIDHSDKKGVVAGYYAGIPVARKKVLQQKSEREIAILQDEAFNYMQFYHSVYFFINNKKLEELLDQHDEFEKIAIQGKKKSLAVFRAVKNANKQKNVINVIVNGDFSQIQPFALKVPSDRQLSCPSGVIPQHWFVNFGHGCRFGSNAVVEVIDGWDGNALRISGNKEVSVVANDYFSTASGSWKISMQYKLIKGWISIVVYTYDKNKKYLGYSVVDTMNCVNNKVNYHRSSLFFEEDSKICFFRPVFTVSGDVSFDNICLTEMRKNK